MLADLFQQQRPMTSGYFGDILSSNKLKQQQCIDKLVEDVNTNHDENSWNGTVEERMGDLGNAMYVLASMMKRGFPLIYSGQEAGLNHRYPFFSKDTVGLDWSKSHAQSDFFAQMLALKHEHQALFNGELGYDMALEIDTATNSMRIWRGEEGETDEVIAIFEFS